MTAFVDKAQSTAVAIYEPPVNALSASQSRLQQVRDLFLKKSFEAQVADYRHFHRNWMGDIVALAGTSTAGKTSIIKALRKLEPDRIETGIDMKGDEETFKCLKKHCPNEVAILEHFMEPLDIAKAIWASERKWKASVSQEDKIVAESAIQRLKECMDDAKWQEMEAIFDTLELKIFDEVFECSRRGQRVIFDPFDIDAFAQRMIATGFDGPLRFVLVYCPFHTLSSRMEKRNKEAQESGELSNQRIGEFPLIQFSNIYSKKATGQRTLEVISRTQAIEAFNKNFDNGIAAARLRGVKLPPEELILINKDNKRKEFLGRLGFEDGIDSVEIAPRDMHYYQFIIDSSKWTPETSAQFLHQGSGL